MVAGAGVFGLCTALRAVVAGADVQVWDAAPFADNASGVAAGMIAPAGEILLAGAGAKRAQMFKAGRDGWRRMASLAPALNLDTSGAVVFLPDAKALATAKRRLTVFGGVAHVPDPKVLHGMVVPPGSHALFTSEDWRVDPQAAMSALRAAIIAHGGVFESRCITPADFGRFDAVILAAGMQSRSFAGLAPELLNLSPIKGQIVRFDGGPAFGPILRTAELYLAPQPTGTLAGATMELGVDDRRIDAGAIETLRRRAITLAPELADRPFRGFAGVRASTPDGLPMVGPSSRRGLLLATGARRNGWLLAPLVSEILLSYLSGGDGGPFAAALDPGRFLRA